MYTKEQIVAKLEEFLQYSIAQIPTLDYEEKETFDSYYTSIVSSGKSSVSSYFSVDRSKFKKPLDDLGLYVHNGIWERNAKWEKEFDMGYRTDYPEYYNDLRKLFYQFDWFMNLTNDDFFNAWVYASPESDDPTMPPEPPVPESNGYISRLKSDLILVATESETGEVVSKPIIQQEMENIDALGTWLETSSGDYSPIMLWEDTGALVSAPTTQDIAKIVFIDRGLLEAVEVLGLPMYIPTYLRK